MPQTGEKKPYLEAEGLMLDYPGSLKPKGEHRWLPFRSVSLLLPWLADGSLHIHIQFRFIFTASFSPCIFLLTSMLLFNMDIRHVGQKSTLMTSC